MTATQLLEGDTRRATAGHLTYPAGVRPDPLTPMGPNTLGEHLWPVTVEDIDDGWRRWRGGVWFAPEGANPIPEPKGARTRVGFTHQPPPA